MKADVFCPMPGTILKILVNVGDAVQEDDELLILEAMKMEVPVCAPSAGCVREIHVTESQAAKAQQVLVVIE